MSDESCKPLAAYGFLTVVESAEHGLFGGYLVLSPLGRPLEFRCTAPIQASRAQEILYGPTLKPYLMAEVIGAALVDSGKSPVAAILTDRVDVLPLALLRDEPVLLVADEGTPQAAESCLLTAEQIAALVEPIARHVELAEPFERIRAALAEAQAATHDPGSDADAPAAAA